MVTEVRDMVSLRQAAETIIMLRREYACAVELDVQGPHGPGVWFRCSDGHRLPKEVMDKLTANITNIALACFVETMGQCAFCEFPATYGMNTCPACGGQIDWPECVR